MHRARAPGWTPGCDQLAERAGFEPAVELPPHTLSKRAPSATRTPLLNFSIMAERKGFEPLDPVKGQRFSRPPRSTTPAPLRTGIGILRFSSFFGKEEFEELTTGGGLESTAVGEGGSEAAVLRQIEHRSTGTGFGIVGSPYHQIEARLATGGGAHRTGFEGHIESAIVEPEIAGTDRCLADSQDFGVGRRVTKLAPAIARTTDDLTLANNNGADRHLIAVRRRCRLDQCGRHEATVVVIEDPVRKHRFERYLSSTMSPMKIDAQPLVRIAVE